MIYTYLEGHNFNYEVFELLRLFFNDDEIQFIDENALVDNQSILLENRLIKTNNKMSVKTIIYRNGEMLTENIIEDINEVKIEREDITKKIKVSVKKSILESFVNITKKKIPWGILTGIRPTKIVHELLDNKINDKDIFKTLTNEYLISSENAKLLLEIANRERKYVYPIDNNSFSLYVGIPFCPTRCLYCSFPSHSLDKWGSLVEKYTEKVINEIEAIGKLTKNRNINTVYIGGGTPTAIPTRNLERIIQSIYNVYGKENLNEFTVEAGRPDTINFENLNMLYENGIDRISINPQTMNDGTLELIGRKHTSEDIVNTYNSARKIGFNSINMDIIVGLPKENDFHVKKTMNEIKKLDPDNLTVHTMAIKKASKLKENINNYNLKDQESLQEMINTTKEYAYTMDLKPYYMYRQKQILGNFENIGYSKEGKECIYNIMIMEERETIIAAGAGATSKLFYPSKNRIERIPNVKNVKDYVERVDDMILRKKKFLVNVDNN